MLGFLHVLAFFGLLWLFDVFGIVWHVWHTLACFGMFGMLVCLACLQFVGILWALFWHFVVCGVVLGMFWSPTSIAKISPNFEVDSGSDFGRHQAASKAKALIFITMVAQSQGSTFWRLSAFEVDFAGQSGSKMEPQSEQQ